MEQKPVFSGIIKLLLLHRTTEAEAEVEAVAEAESNKRPKKRKTIKKGNKKRRTSIRKK